MTLAMAIVLPSLDHALFTSSKHSEIILDLNLRMLVSFEERGREMLTVELCL